MVYTTISGIASASQDAAALIDSFYALDGGRPYKDLTTTEYATQRTAAQQAKTVEDGLAAVKDRIDAVDNAARTAARQSNATEQSIMQAANAAWESGT